MFAQTELISNFLYYHNSTLDTVKKTHEGANAVTFNRPLRIAHRQVSGMKRPSFTYPSNTWKSFFKLLTRVSNDNTISSSPAGS